MKQPKNNNKSNGKIWLGKFVHSHPSLCHPNEQRPLAGDPGDCDGWGTRAFVAGLEKATTTATAITTATATVWRLFGYGLALWVGFDGFDGDGVGGVAGGEHGE